MGSGFVGYAYGEKLLGIGETGWEASTSADRPEQARWVYRLLVQGLATGTDPSTDLSESVGGPAQVVYLWWWPLSASNTGYADSWALRSKDGPSQTDNYDAYYAFWSLSHLNGTPTIDEVTSSQATALGATTVSGTWHVYSATHDSQTYFVLWSEGASDYIEWDQTQIEMIPAEKAKDTAQCHKPTTVYDPVTEPEGCKANANDTTIYAPEFATCYADDAGTADDGYCVHGGTRLDGLSGRPDWTDFDDAGTTGKFKYQPNTAYKPIMIKKP